MSFCWKLLREFFERGGEVSGLVGNWTGNCIFDSVGDSVLVAYVDYHCGWSNFVGNNGLMRKK